MRNVFVNLWSISTRGPLERPQHLDGFGQSHVIEVEVDESSKAQNADDVPHILDPGNELDQVVCQHPSHAPVQRKSKIIVQQ